MDQLFPFAEAELSSFERTRAEFGRRYPRLAGRLAGNSHDPHVLRLTQGVALLNARTAKRLHDEYPLYVEALFHVLYPHYLRSFPSCVIVQGGEGAFMQAGDCRFRLAGARPAHGAAITAARFSGGVMTLRINGGGRPLPDSLRVFLDGEQAFCAALRDALMMHVRRAALDTGGGEIRLQSSPMRSVGFDAADALLPRGPRHHEGCRLLSEFFGFPEKFAFVDIDLSAAHGALEATLRLELGGAALAGLDAANLLTDCAPAINLFPLAARPFIADGSKTHHIVAANVSRPEDYEIYSIDRVRLGHEEYHPFYTRRHEEAGGRYWLERRNPAMARAAPGYEVSIAFSRAPGVPVPATIDLSCSNRDHARQLAPGTLLRGECGAGKLLRKPSMAHRIPQAAGNHWRLVSHLSLATRSLVREGLEPFLETLALYDVARSAITQAQIAAVRRLEHRPATFMMRDRHGAAQLHGVEVRLHVDEAGLAGCGVHLFAGVIDNFLGLYVHLNSFVQLVLVSSTTGQELLRCQPRNGNFHLG
jgi:type VI secretion system protein ImpG